MNDIANSLSTNLSIVKFDIFSCFNLVHSNTSLKEIAKLEILSGIIYSKCSEDISTILGSNMLSMKEKKKFLEMIQEKSMSKDVLESIKFEDSLT